MATFSVEVSHSISTTVKVDADSAEEAAQYVNRRSFPLPPRDEWSGGKDWRYIVCNEAGNVLHEAD